MNNELWTFKYTPENLSDLIVPEDIRETLQNCIKESPNMILSGPPGIGKGAFVDIFLKETEFDFIKINASDETSVDTIRNKVKSFATALGITDIKIVYLNEADYLSPNAQAMLRQLQEDVQEFTRFVYAVNYANKLIDPILSRCQLIQFKNPPAKDILKRCIWILENENVEYDNESIVKIIKGYYPDIRRTINELQKNVSKGKLNKVDTLAKDQVFDELFGYMKEQDPDKVRKILKTNTIDYTSLYEYIYENVPQTENPAEAVLCIGEYMYRDSIVAIKEINFMTMFFEMIKRRCF